MSERSVNKLILVGRVGRDPEMRSTGTGKRVASFSLATNRHDDTPDWHRISAWDKLGEIVEQYVKKGDKLYIEGRVEYREHEGKWYTDVIAREMVMLGSGDGARASEPAPAPASPFDDEPDGMPF